MNKLLTTPSGSSCAGSLNTKDTRRCWWCGMAPRAAKRTSPGTTASDRDKRGRAQAEALRPQLLAFGATERLCRRPRCHQTMEPLAGGTERDHTQRAHLTEESLRQQPQTAADTECCRSSSCEYITP